MVGKLTVQYIKSMTCSKHKQPTCRNYKQYRSPLIQYIPINLIEHCRLSENEITALESLIHNNQIYHPDENNVWK